MATVLLFKAGMVIFLSPKQFKITPHFSSNVGACLLFSLRCRWHRDDALRKKVELTRDAELRHEFNKREAEERRAREKAQKEREKEWEEERARRAQEREEREREREKAREEERSTRKRSRSRSEDRRRDRRSRSRERGREGERSGFHDRDFRGGRGR